MARPVAHNKVGGISGDGRRVWWYEEHAGASVRRWRRVADAAEGRAVLAALTAPGEPAVRVPSPQAPNDLVFGAFLAAHASEPEGTQRRYRSVIDAWLLPAMAERSGEEMSLAVMLKPLQAAMAAGLKPRSVAAVETALGAIATWAVAEGWWPPNPFGDERTRVAQVRELKRSSRRQDADQRAQQLEGGDDGDSDAGIELGQVPSWALIEGLRKSIEARERHNPGRRPGGRCFGLSEAAARQVARSVELAAATGLRECELLALHASCVDLRTGEIDVVRQLDRYQPWVGQRPPVRAPKYGKRRTAMVFAFYNDALGELCDWACANTGGWLFAPTRGQRWWAEGWEATVTRGVTLMNAWASQMPLGAPGAGTWRWRRHYLRHWYGTHAVAAPQAGGFGLSLALVASLMGHSSPAITSGIYLQETAGDRNHARQATAMRPD